MILEWSDFLFKMAIKCQNNFSMNKLENLCLNSNLIPPCNFVFELVFWENCNMFLKIQSSLCFESKCRHFLTKRERFKLLIKPTAELCFGCWKKPQPTWSKVQPHEKEISALKIDFGTHPNGNGNFFIKSTLRALPSHTYGKHLDQKSARSD